MRWRGASTHAAAREAFVHADLPHAFARAQDSATGEHGPELARSPGTLLQIVPVLSFAMLTLVLVFAAGRSAEQRGLVAQRSRRPLRATKPKR